MSYIRVETLFFLRPKITAVGPDAALLFLAGMCYCAREHTRDYIPESALPGLKTDVQARDINSLVARLLAERLWALAPQGFVIKDWLECSICYDEISPARKLWNRVRHTLTPQVYARDGFRCQYCGALNQLSVDHIVPLSRGGSNDLSNLRTACRPCNSAKHAKTLDEWSLWPG